MHKLPSSPAPQLDRRGGGLPGFTGPRRLRLHLQCAEALFPAAAQSAWSPAAVGSRSSREHSAGLYTANPWESLGASWEVTSRPQSWPLAALRG